MNYCNNYQERLSKIFSLCLFTSILLSTGSLLNAETIIHQTKVSSPKIISTTADHSRASDIPKDKVSIDLVMVGDPHNATSSIKHGAVPYVFYIGKYNVTADQYCAFLNAVAATDTYGLYDERMGKDSKIPARIQRSGSSGSYTYSVVSGKEDDPIVYVSYLSAQRFCNWLQNGQPSGDQGEGTTETGSYTLNGTITTIFPANDTAEWRLPNRDESFKAAYYKGNGTHAGYWRTSRLIGAYGTYDMTGPISQWSSGTVPLPMQKLSIHGKDHKLGYCDANYRSNTTGFRVVGPAAESVQQ